MYAEVPRVIFTSDLSWDGQSVDGCIFITVQEDITAYKGWHHEVQAKQETNAGSYLRQQQLTLSV